MKKQVFFLTIITIEALFLGLLPQVASAANISGIQVAPYEQVVTVNPGETKLLEFYLNNNQNQAVTVTSSYMDFESQGPNSGTPSYFKPSSSIPSVYADSWFMPVNTVVPANKNVKISVIMNVPKDANPGAHYAGIFFQPSEGVGITPNNSTSLNIQGKIAVPVLITVTGDIKENLSVTNMFTDNSLYNIFSIPSSTFCPGIVHCESNINVYFHNTGNVHESPNGIIEVYSMFGSKVLTIDSINTTNKFVLAKSDRQLSVNLPVNEISGLKLGIFKAKFTGVYGKDNTMISSEASFFVIDWTYVIGFILLISIPVCIYVFKKRGKKY